MTSRRRGPAAAAVMAVVAVAGTVATSQAGAGKAGADEPHGPSTGSCRLPGVAAPVKHVVELTFDNVHLSRDNPNVPSDLEQMPNLLHFVENNGVMLSDNHTPLIAHTADDILTQLTGVYGSTHGQPVANSYFTYGNTSGGTVTPTAAVKSSSFAYWTDPVTNPAATDKTPTMNDDGKVAPAPWVPFTRAGCDVGAFGTANMEIENPATDLPVIFGQNSPEVAQYDKDSDPFHDQEVADYEGIAVHCAATAGSVCNRSHAVADSLPDEPGGYNGFQGLFGNKYVAPAIGGTGAGSTMISDLGGTPIVNPFTGTPGFPGFDPTASQTLGYLASMQEHGVAVTYGYIEDAHQNYATDQAAGPGDPAYEANLQADDAAFGAFFDRLQRDGITPQNTLFVITADEGDHFAGTQNPTPDGCDGVHNFCSYPKGQIGEVQTTINGLLAEKYGAAVPTGYQIEADSAPNFYLDGNPPAGDPQARLLEQDLAGLTAPDPYAPGGQAKLTNYAADQVEENILHMVTGDPDRTPTFTDFANPDFFVQTARSCPAPSSTQTATSDPCVLVNPAFAWDHGDVAPDINTTWLGLVGPGVAHKGLDSTTWADHTDIRPTLMYLAGLKDDYQHAGRVLFEDLGPGSGRATRGGDASGGDSSPVVRLAQVYKQLEAAVGSFGHDTLVASTNALSSSSTNDSAYTTIEGKLSGLGARRDALASKIITSLENVEFGGGSLSASQAGQLTQQAQALLNEAHAVATSS